jgi:hypothetical protein
MTHKSKRCKYSRCFGKKGKTMKRKLYSYYNKMSRSVKKTNLKKKGG